MNIRSLVGVSVVGVLMFTFVPSASAADTGATTATFTITSGALAITVPAASVSLGSFENVVGGGTVSGSLGSVQVTDARSATAGWVASVISEAFTPTTGPAIAASAVGYTAGPINKVGTATYTANNRTGLTAAGPVVTASAITGDNSATWSPTITVTVPGGMAATDYSAAITHSVV